MTFAIELTFAMTEGTDSTSTDTYDIGTILSHFHWWILRLSAIQNKISDSLNNIGLKDASASKNYGHIYLKGFIKKISRT